MKHIWYIYHVFIIHTIHRHIYNYIHITYINCIKRNGECIGFIMIRVLVFDVTLFKSKNKSKELKIPNIFFDKINLLLILYFI